MDNTNTNTNTLESKVKELLRKDKYKLRITEKICTTIDDNDLCPATEGVPCSECMKFALEVLLDKNNNT
jgi:hypothetical protein